MTTITVRWLLGVAVVVAAAALAGCEQQRPAAKPTKPKLVKAIRVADASGLAERVFPGRVRAAREVNLSFRVSGPLITLPVKVGDTVSVGDVLATLDPTDFQNRLATVEGELSTARAQAALAQREWERGRDIDARGGNLISKSELDKRRGARDRSRAQVQALTGSLQLARDQLSYTTLRAPFDGVVVAKYVENFEDVVAKRPVVRLVDASAIEVDIDVPEGLIGYAPYVESVELRFDALPELELTAQIKEVGREASQTTRTYPVTLSAEPPVGVEVLPGMVARATIVSRPPAAAREVGIEIPASALRAGGDGPTSQVFVVDESSMTLQAREVNVSLLSNTGVLVKEGLAPSEWLVVAGVNSVKAGQRVRILDAASGVAAK